MSDELKIKVLVVEDNPLDVLLVKVALKRAGLLEEPTVVDDGAPAISLLSREGPYKDAPRFGLVILDLNLKLVDGPDVLRYIRSDPEIAQTTVAILSSSPEDVMRSQAAQANCFFRKGSVLESIPELGRKIIECFARHNVGDSKCGLSLN